MNKNITITFLFLLLFTFKSNAKTNLNYYLPESNNYDQKIPTPESFLGYQIGDWHISHDQLVYYCKELAKKSERITYQEYGRTYEDRPLFNLIITSPENQKNIELIRKEHLKLSNPEKADKLDISKMPAILSMGYSIHGNESSGTNSSVLMAYHLASAKDKETKNILDKTIILLDPSFNPDGGNRFSSWVNSHKSKNLISDRNNREHLEAWPYGRTNHYWFDLNRDWLPVQHPESKGRIKLFHKWKPNFLTDHHEMGPDSTFFFQPGVTSRNNPLTEQKVYDLTNKIAKFHIEELDKIGSLFFTKEKYDDFYAGKGSTYPDLNGSIGILFEQARVLGHSHETDNGILTFPFAIRNQVKASFSTIKAVYEYREDLLEYQRNFFKNAIKNANKFKTKAYIFGLKHDKSRVNQFLEILLLHNIEVYKLSENKKVNDINFNSDNAYIIPMKQAQFKFIRSLFEKLTKFDDELFYDVSTWTLPPAFNIDYTKIENNNYKNYLGEKLNEVEKIKPDSFDLSNYAYILDWKDYYSPKLLNKLFEKGIRVKVSTTKFKTKNNSFDYGDILIPVKNQKLNSKEIYNLLVKIQKETPVSIKALNSGYTISGSNLGSSNFITLEKPEIALLVGEGVRMYDAGEIWHLLDQRFDIKLTLLPIDMIKYADLNKYNTIIMVHGYYSSLDNSFDNLSKWVKNGGNLIAMKNAIKYISNKGLAKFKFHKANKSKQKRKLKYKDIKNYYGRDLIGGAIFNAKLDLSHPLSFGYEKESIKLFRNTKIFLKSSKNPFSSPLRYTEKPLFSGYITKVNIETLKNTPAITVASNGKGKIIGFTDNPTFRAYWFGTNKLLLNSIFFGQIINSKSTLK